MTRRLKVSVGCFIVFFALLLVDVWSAPLPLKSQTIVLAMVGVILGSAIGPLIRRLSTRREVPPPSWAANLDANAWGPLRARLSVSAFALLVVWAVWAQQGGCGLAALILGLMVGLELQLWIAIRRHRWSSEGSNGAAR